MKLSVIGEKTEPASTICTSGIKITQLEFEVKNLILRQNCKKIIIKVED